MAGATYVNPENAFVGKFDTRLGPWAANIEQTTVQLTKSANSIGAVSEQDIASEKEFLDLMHDFPETIAYTIPLSESFKVNVSPQDINPFNIGIANGLNPYDSVAASYSEVAKSSTSGTYDDTKLSFDNDGTPADTFIFVFTDETNFKCYSALDGYLQDGGSDGAVASEFAPENGSDVYFTMAANFFTGTWAAGDTLTLRMTPYVAAGSNLSRTTGEGGEIKLGSILAPEIMRCELHFQYPNGDYMYVVLPRAQVKSPLSLATSISEASAMSWEIVAISADSSVDGISVTTWDTMPLGRIYWSS